MLEKNDLDIIERFNKGEITDSQREYVENLFLTGEENLYLRKSLEKYWDLMLRDPAPSQVNLSPLLDRIHHTIRKNEMLKKKRPLQKIGRIYMRVAAIIILPLLVAGGIFNFHQINRLRMLTDQQSLSTIYAPMGARVSFKLPDGTTGMLNSGSYLWYSLPFSVNRQIKLEGEAWFEVTPDKKHPFEIIAGGSTLRVLGTSFNVSAYPSENYTEVVLNTGRMEFLTNASEEKIKIDPSERLVFKNGNISKSVTDPSKYSAWTEGKLVFRGDPMTEVVRRIERWYNVRINLNDKELEKYSFRGIFQDDTLEGVLKFLAMTSPIRYKIKPEELMADGTFKKEEVTIYLRK
jgi:transmembrane sensor